jgi:hypothetical protein
VKLIDNDLNEALQYSQTIGLPKFYEWVINHQKNVFKPILKNDEWSCLISNGSQDSLCKGNLIF